MPESPVIDECADWLECDADEDESEAADDMPQGPEEISQTASASYSDADGRVTITYDDSELLEMPQTTTQITFLKSEPSVVSIVRSGSLSGMIVIEEGRHHTGEYRFGPYSLPVSFYGRRVSNAIADGEGVLELDYTVEISGADAQRTKMKITVTK